MRASSTFIFLLGVVGFAIARPASAECVWVEPKAPPKLEVQEGYANFSWRLDREWYACAKAAGGELTAEFLLGDASVKMSSFQVKPVKNALLQQGIYRSGFCKHQPLPDRLQVKVVGTGAFAPATWTSPVTTGIHCDRCERQSWKESLAVFVTGALTRPGVMTIRGEVGEEFSACARTDSKLEIRVFLGRTAREASTRQDPTFVIRGIESKAKFQEVVSRAEICADRPEYLGVELFGDGEFARLNGSRSVHAAKCTP